MAESVIENQEPAASGPSAAPSVAGCSRGQFWIAVLLVFAAFAAYGIIRTPIPGANEPNYLSKAKNFWEPTWCSRDLYLQSGNSHWVFYATWGALTKVLTLEQTAWLGRIVVWFLLAIGWVRMTVPLAGGRAGSVVAACLFLAWSAFTHTNFAGEWVIGGVEGKGFAYAFLWMGIGALFQDRRREAAIWTGLAISYHPVVGMWGLLCAIAAVATISWGDFWLRTSKKNITVVSPARELPNWPRGILAWLVPGTCLVLASLPGFIPALAVLTENPGPDLARQADELQIFVRLRHHLDPTTFSAYAYQTSTVLLTLWLLLLGRTAHTWPQRWFARYVTASIVIAVGGVLLAWGHLAAREYGIAWFLPFGRFLKFYFFRTADLLIPIAVALQLATLLEQWRQRTVAAGGSLPAVRRFAPTGICAIAITFALLKPYPPPPPGTPLIVTPQFLSDWTAACQWINKNTPRDALFLIPRYNRNFKWYAERAEYFSYKDMPQDAVRLLEWNRRRLLLDDWGSHHFLGDRSTREELRNLAAVAGPDHPDYAIFYSWLKVVDQPPLYRNGSFAIYALEPPPPK